MSQDQLKECYDTPGDTPDKFEAVDLDHYAKIINVYAQDGISEIGIIEPAPFGSASLKYVIAFVCLLGAMHFWSKNLMQFQSVNPFEILFVRGVISSMLGLIYMRRNDLSLFNINSQKIPMVVSGAILAFLSLCGLYLSLYTLSITDAFALDFLSLLVTTFIDYIIFQGNLKFSQFVGYICAFIGILFLVRPSYLFEETNDIDEKNNFVYGFIAGLFSAFLAGVHSGILRRTFVRVDTMVSITYKETFTVILSPVAIGIFWLFTGKLLQHTVEVWVSLVCIGIIGWFSNYFLYLSLKEEKLIARIFPFKFGLVIIGIVSDLLYFKCELIPSTYIGLCLIGVNFVLAAYNLFLVMS